MTVIDYVAIVLGVGCGAVAGISGIVSSRIIRSGKTDILIRIIILVQLVCVMMIAYGVYLMTRTLFLYSSFVIAASIITIVVLNLVKVRIKRRK